MPPDPFPTVQRSFVLRLWIEPQPSGEQLWRCVLLDPHGDSRIGFNSPAELAAYLTALLPVGTQPDEESGE